MSQKAIPDLEVFAEEEPFEDNEEYTEVSQSDCYKEQSKLLWVLYLEYAVKKMMDVGRII